jgi:lipid-A-disaccharide synthase-like uncharacterized protein
MLDWSDSTFWSTLGLPGNATFASRFFIQWVASERAGTSRTAGDSREHCDRLPWV